MGTAIPGTGSYRRLVRNLSRGTVKATKLVGSQEPRVGRKRTTKPPKTLSPIERRFALRLSELIGDNAVEVAAKVGVTPDSVRKWCAGRSVPSLDLWPKLATAVGLTTARELLD